MIPPMLQFFWIVALPAIGLFQYKGDYWHSKWALLLAAAVLELAIRIGRKTSWPAAAAFAYTVLSGLYVFAWRDNYVMGFDKLTGAAMDGVTALTCVSFLLLTWVASSWDEKDFKYVRAALGIVCLVDAVVVLAQVAEHPLKFHVGGLLDQDSMNGCLLAVTYPFAIELIGFESPLQKGLAALPPAAILASSFIGFARVSMGVFLIVVGCFWLCRASWRYMAVVAIGTAILAGLLFGMTPGLFDSNGRFGLYELVFTWLGQQPMGYRVFGFGNGSYFIFGPGIQRLYHFGDWNGSWNLWLHSDWLQVTFEQGAVGLGLYSWLAWDCFWRVLRAGDTFLMAALFGFVATAVFEFPVHVALCAFLGVSIVVMSVTAPRDQSPSFEEFPDTRLPARAS